MQHIFTPQIAPQVVSYDSTTQSTAFATGSVFVRLVASTNCYIAFGTNPTATSAGICLIANVPEYFTVTAGQKVAALKVTVAGLLSCVEGVQL